MKKYIIPIITIIMVTLSLPSISIADTSEKAQVLKFNNDTQDTIVKRQDGTKWLLQHNRVCNSMNIDNLVDLLVDKAGTITDLKIGFNEICEVYNAYPYGGEAKLTKAISNNNALLTEHEAEMVWENNKYLIDYDAGCSNLREFVNKQIFLVNSSSNGGKIVLPSNTGQCTFRFASKLESNVNKNIVLPAKITGLSNGPGANQIYFYWDKMKDGLLYVISYSKYELDLNTYTSWEEMPNLIKTNTNSYTIISLGSDREYYFYFAAVDTKINRSGEWTKLKIVLGNPSIDTSAFPYTIKKMEPIVTTTTPPTPPTTTATPDVEKTELKKLLNYYDIRYQIKCLAVDAKPADDVCLFAKIDIIYAQEILKENKVNISLSLADITLLASRAKWPELRYKKQCTDATSPADFCPALGDAIKRTKYFIAK